MRHLAAPLLLLLALLLPAPVHAEESEREEVDHAAAAERALRTARAHEDADRLEETLVAAEEARRHAREARLPHVLIPATGILARTHHRRGELRGARDELRRLVDLWDRHAVDERGQRERLLTRLDLGTVEVALGNTRAALAILAKAVELTEGSEGDAYLRAHALTRQAHALHLAGELGRAMEDAEAAAALFEEADADLDHGQLLAYVLGPLLGELGDAARAREVYDEARGLLAEAPAPDRAALEGNVAILAYEQGDYAEADRRLRAAQGELLAVKGSPSIPRLVLQRGLLALRRDRPEEALAHVATLPEDDEEVPLPIRLYAHLVQAEAHLLLGEAETGRKRARELALARKLYAQVCTTTATYHDRDLRLRCHAGLARTQLAAGQAKDALANVRIALGEVGGMVDGLAPVVERLGRAQHHEAHEVGVQAALALGEVGPLFEMIEAGRAARVRARRAEDGWLGQDARSQALRAQVVQAREILAAATHRYHVAAERGLLREMAEAVAEQSRAHHAYVTALEAMQRPPAPSSEEGREAVVEAEATRRVLDAEQAAARLPAETSLVLYAISGAQACAAVLEDGKARLVALGPSAPIRKAARDLHEALASPSDGEHAATTPGALARRLRALVVDPLELADGPVYVAPDGLLAYAPPALLLPDRDVAYVPSAAALLDLLEEAPRKGKQVLALGDPDYAPERDGEEHPVYVPEGGRLRQLEGSRLEVMSVAAGEKDIRLLGPDATETRLRAWLASPRRWRAIHLACHGFVHDVEPRRSSLALTPSPEDDGFLTLVELHGLRVRADLVVLSACQTGLGRVLEGQGLLGLSQAFLDAGAPRVIASLWKVDDEATRRLMASFHARWRAGVPAARALAEAQAELAADSEHADPRRWAGWVLWGRMD